jgi:hypothetical protein
MLILATIAIATLLASLTDWLFMDVLVNRYYAASPALWRARGGAARIAVSQAIGTGATVALVLLCLAGVRPFTAAVLVWCAGALPVTLQNLQWMRLPPAVAVSHSTGWLARLLISALVAKVVLL